MKTLLVRALTGASFIHRSHAFFRTSASGAVALACLVVTFSMAPAARAANTWTTTDSLAAPRDFHTATLLHNGKVLVAGGSNNIGGLGMSLTSAELYEITVKDGTVRTVLNGKVVIPGVKIPGMPAKGPIGLQHHGSMKDGQWTSPPALVQFRNIFIKEL